MSGIFGIVNFDGEPVHQADLKRISKTMAHRGPDAANVWSENAVGLGQLMLCSTKESLREPLPWEDSSSGLVITADARIDNRAELLAALSIDSEMAPTIPDSQLILLAFRKWDEACVDHLLGDFSFAIETMANEKPSALLAIGAVDGAKLVLLNNLPSIQNCIDKHVVIEYHSHHERFTKNYSSLTNPLS